MKIIVSALAEFPARIFRFLTFDFTGTVPGISHARILQKIGIMLLVNFAATKWLHLVSWDAFIYASIWYVFGCYDVRGIARERIEENGIQRAVRNYFDAKKR